MNKMLVVTPILLSGCDIAKTLDTGVHDIVAAAPVVAAAAGAPWVVPVASVVGAAFALYKGWHKPVIAVGGTAVGAVGDAIQSSGNHVASVLQHIEEVLKAVNAPKV